MKSLSGDNLIINQGKSVNNKKQIFKTNPKKIFCDWV